LLQDWDGLFFFDYGGGSESRWKDTSIPSFFSMANDPVKMPQTALGALMFLRGDVSTANKMVERHITHDLLVESLRSRPNDKHPYSITYMLGRLALVYQTAVGSFHSDEIKPRENEITLPENEIVSDTGELIWKGIPGDSRVLIKTKLYQAIIGHKGHSVTENMDFDLETPFAAIQLISLDEKPIAISEKMLMVTVARTANTDMKWVDDTRLSLGDQWGKGPARIELVTGTLTLKDLKDATEVILKPLDNRGQLMGIEKKLERNGEEWNIKIDGSYNTIWYLIEVKR